MLITIALCPLRYHRWLDGGAEDFEGVLAGAGESSLSSLPVDDVPDVVNVSSLAVEILSQY